jgi:ribosome-associated translation inhibitor RaiA
LTIRIEHTKKHNAYILNATLRLGNETFHHVDDTHDPKKAIDRTEANLILQAKKFVGRLKERKKPKNKRVRRKKSFE